MNRPQRSHNPGNLRFAGQKESIGRDEGGFALFLDDPAGWRALVRQIRLDQDRGDSIEKFIREYAPASENDTEAYIAHVCEALSLARDAPLSSVSPYAIAGVVAQWEGYFVK